MLTFFILGLFGILAGINSCLFGFGGGFVVIPLIYHILGSDNPYNMHVAVATSTSIMAVNSFNATYKHNKNNNILWNMVYPLFIYIGIGALIGVYLTQFMNANIIRWGFISYVIYAIYRCLSEKNFIHRNKAIKIKPINKYVNVILGIVIGVVAASLGVGGGVLTVPLMRQLGAKMKNAVAMANPLTFPVGLIGTVGYIISPYLQHIELGVGYLGFIYLHAFIFLIVGGFIGVAIGSRLVNKIPDTLHAKIYVSLLVTVVIIMLI